MVNYAQIESAMTQRILMPFTKAVVGGSFVSASLLAKGLIELGNDVVAIFPEEGPSTTLFRKQGIPVQIADLPVIARAQRTPLGIIRHFMSNVTTWKRASRILSKLDVDVVHCNDDGSILPWGLAARENGLRCIWHVRNARAGIIDPLRLRLSHKAVCISHFVARRLPHTPKKSVLYNPIDTNVFRAVDDKAAIRRSLGLPETGVQFIQIGRDVPYKRPEWAIRALKAALVKGINARLVYLGDYRAERQLALRAMLPLEQRDRIVFAGWVDNPQDWLACSDLLLHPADGEHFGRIFIEAAACGVRFVATDTGAAPELVAAGLDGELLSDWTEGVATEAAMENFVSKNPKLIRDQFSSLFVARKFTKVIG